MHHCQEALADVQLLADQSGSAATANNTGVDPIVRLLEVGFKLLGELQMEGEPPMHEAAMNAFRSACPGLPDCAAGERRMQANLRRALRNAEPPKVHSTGVVEAPAAAAALQRALSDVPYAATLGTCYGFLAEDALSRQEANLAEYSAATALLTQHLTALDQLESSLLLPTAVANTVLAPPAPWTPPAELDLLDPRLQVRSLVYPCWVALAPIPSHRSTSN